MTVTWIEKVQSWVYPPTCLLCGGHGQSPHTGTGGLRDLCEHCQQDLTVIVNACSQCAAPLTHSAASHSRCGQCQKKPPPFSAAFTALLYCQPLDKLIQRYKFSRHMPAGRLLSQLFADAVEQAIDHDEIVRPDALIAVPLHHQRLRERGFNQAQELAKPLARRLGLPLISHGIQRIRMTDTQSHLDVAARRRNVKGAFVVDADVNGLSLALIDDVLTSGSTLSEFSRTLLRAGADDTQVWTLARAAGGAGIQRQ